jgi:ribonuclease Z
VNNFTLTTLGTASAVPVVNRFPSAQVLHVHERLFLIDCGEGAQMQMKRFGISLMKIDSIYISHIHGDHVFGLFGLLSTIGMFARSTPLNIYGPPNLGPIVKFLLSFYGNEFPCEVRFTPLTMKEPEVIYHTKSMEILAFPLNHKIETFGYLFREKEPQWNVRKDSLAEYGFSLTEIGAIKRGEDVFRGDTCIKNSEVAYKPSAPRSYAYCSDTAPFPQLPEWVKGVDMLYHETTYLNEYADQAEQRHHSTTLQAARCALEAGAGRLVIGHYSSRCQDIDRYLQECKSIFPNTSAANDGDVFDLPYIKNE